MKKKFKYWYNGEWAYIDLEQPTVPQFELWEKRGRPKLLQSTGAMIGDTIGGNEIYDGDVIYDEIEGIYDYVVYYQDLGIWTCKNNSLDIDEGIVSDWSSIYDNINRIGLEEFEKLND